MTTPTDETRAAGIPGDDAVRKATGRDWSDWFTALDAAGAAELDHRGIVARTTELGAGDWWAQTISVAYEQARGKRILHQRADGFAVSASRTIDAPPDVLHAAFADPATRARWLPEPVELTKSTPARTLRLRAPDGSRINVYVYARGDRRAAVNVQHERLPDQETATATKARWAGRLVDLERLVTG